jgi:hypothetical protein
MQLSKPFEMTNGHPKSRNIDTYLAPNVKALMITSRNIDTYLAPNVKALMITFYVTC